MEKITRIVAAVDGSEQGGRALPVAAALADQARVSLSLLTVAIHGDHVAPARELQRSACVQLGRSPACEVLVGAPIADQLINRVQDEPGSILVMATHARPAVAELLLGSVTDDVLRSSPCPTVLVGPHADVSRAGDGFSELIVCLDTSEAAEGLVPVASRIGEDFHLHKWLFEVLDPPTRDDHIRDAYETNYLRQLIDTQPALEGDVDWDVGHDQDPAAAIVRFAEIRDAPLIALATRSRKPHERLHESSTTVRVAHHAPCPVLVIGPAFADVSPVAR